MFAALLCASSSRISTHAPAGGATVGGVLPVTNNANFYSRPCGRGDPLVAASTTALHNISTHAPAGGATVGGVLPVTNNANFYSRPCGRGDQHL